MLLLTAAEMRALDRATIDAGHASGAELMERAGQGVALAAGRHFGSPLALRTLVLCGTGNNGGDGFVAARHLRTQGARVEVVVAGARERVPGDARAHLERLEADGGAVRFAADDAELAALGSAAEPFDWAFDALLGTGSKGAPGGLVAAGVRTLLKLRARGAKLVAVDLPTGVSADDGVASEPVVAAHLTVTFGALKRGQFLHPGRGLCGAIELVDIGLLPAERAGLRPAELATPAELGVRVPLRDPRAHKGSVGRVLLVAGSMGYAGGAVLAARAATRAGAGYVRVAAPASLVDVLATRLTEAMPVPCGEGTQRALTRTAAGRILEEASQARAVAIGPGLSRDPDTAALARELIARIERPLVIDADALIALPRGAEVAPALAAAGAPRVLTPHLGEMAALTGESPEALEARRIDAAREWAKRWGCVLVVKGAPTVVADASGRASVNPSGNPGMATAGMGDVLTGTIVALLGQGLEAWDAARLGVLAHGAAGDLAAAEIGPIGLVAGDVAERLPTALHRLAGASLAGPAGAT
ncbi:MAG TPA: NAD(P)H-hydrate dehydratase [Candidatus Acidoferrales bacterium]|nr:NAD(P)H-hydrate dehydratase [Candidatus Acidoferrales bacterium]